MSTMQGLLNAEARGKESATNIWLTPRWLLDALGPFDLDPCAVPEPEKYPTAQKHFTEADNGLYKPWEGIVWVNPPYGVNTQDWVQAWIEHGNGFLLVACRADTQWFHDAMNGCDMAWFPRGRIRFNDFSTGQMAGSPAFASVVFAAGRVPHERLSKMKGCFVNPWLGSA